MNYVGTLLGLGIGLMFVGILVGIVYYVAFSWSHMKALKALGYDKAWLAWIPFGVLFACSDAVTGDGILLETMVSGERKKRWQYSF